MTKRAVIITTSVLVGLITIVATLFGAVFRVRNIKVACGDDFCYKAQLSQIVADSKIRKNKSIFSINCKQAASNIEKAWPKARVEGVNVTSFVGVKIKLSNREPLYYVYESGKYYILDEDCKVLEITADIAEAQKYILLDNAFSLGDNVQAGYFVQDSRAKVFTNLYKAIYSNAVLDIGADEDEDGNPDAKYLDRADMCSTINGIQVSQTVELNGQVDKLVMTTSYGVKISVVDLAKQLDLKINMAFSALRTLLQRDKGEANSGTIAIRYSYDQHGNASPKCEYYADV